MKISVTTAKGPLTELVRRVEGGEDIVLSEHSHPAVRLVPVQAKPSREERYALLQALQEAAAAHALPGPSAERSQDFLYGENGLPG